MFRFVKIPADINQSPEEIEADKAGGLENDALVKHAKEYFHSLTGSKVWSDQFEKATPAEKKKIADQIRSQFSGGKSDMLDGMDDDEVLNVVYRSQSQPSCEIMAVTIPSAGNNYEAVSMYSAENAIQHGLPLNERATALLTACGHTGQVHGDAFCGRASDNEASDVWKRIDFVESEIDPSSEWCITARGRGGGGGSGKSAASSLSGLIQQQRGGNMQVLEGNAASPSLYGVDGASAVIESWGSWTQDDSEVELKFSVAPGTKAKYCKIQFGKTSLKVSVAGQTLLQGTLFDPVPADECTYTIESTGDTRELYVTLYKSEPRTWSYITAQQ